MQRPLAQENSLSEQGRGAGASGGEHGEVVETFPAGLLKAGGCLEGAQ